MIQRFDDAGYAEVSAETFTGWIERDSDTLFRHVVRYTVVLSEREGWELGLGQDYACFRADTHGGARQALAAARRFIRSVETTREERDPDE